MNFKRILPILIAGLLMPFLMNAQVTTSSITGFVKSSDGQPIEGATITAVHVPSGTKYFTVSQKDGNFTIPNARIGGPYSITAESVGFASSTINDAQLILGDAFNAQFVLTEKASELSEVTVLGLGSANIVKTGVSTNISNREIQTMPGLSRDISDYTRLTPQAAGNAFAGQDSRLNNLKVDGANLNNNFGLSSDPMPGGLSPISIETFDQISVNVAPFDVRQSGFTGAGINVTTKSGTNTLHGSAYGFYRNQNFNGDKADGQKVNISDQTNKVFGFTLGGPIIKDKLFFFGNYEHENNQTPNPNTFVPDGSTAPGTASAAPKADLDKFRDALISKYKYDPGVYDNRPNFAQKARRILGKIDWNISTKHKLTLKYSDYKGSDQSPVNGSSVPNSTVESFRIFNPSDLTKNGGFQSRLPNNRNSAQSIAFSNSDYGTNHVVQSATVELNSTFNSRWSNQLLFAYTHIDDARFSPGGFFPTVTIFNGDGSVPNVTQYRNYMTAGTDPFTRNNEVINNISSITDNATLFAGRHTITFGGTYEYQKVGNAFMGGSESLYMYNSLDDFLNNAAPAYYNYTYAYDPSVVKIFSANLKIGQLGLYVQDEFNINSNFKLTYGIRGDVPIYVEQPLANPAIEAFQFPDRNGVMKSFSVGHWPKSRLLLSPRVGFRWKVPNEPGLVLHGGMGIFTGKIPFVFLTNMPSNSGVYQNAVAIADNDGPVKLTDVLFDPDPDAHRGLFPAKPPTTAPGGFVLIDPDFKFPQVFRANFGFDKSLGSGFTASVDLMYSKNINAVKMRDANLIAPAGTLTGEDDRPYYPSTQSGNLKRLYPQLGNIIMLENISKGYAFQATAQIKKSFSKGFYGSLAYTYTDATEISPNPGSRAASAWQSIVNRGTPNDVELYPTQYALPHRVVGTISYRLEYAQHFATTVSLYYQGASQGTMNYIVGGDINGDGNNASDLMFIYAKGSEVPFVDIKDKNNNVTHTVAEQAQAYDEFVASSSYLTKHKGQYAQRNASLYPWYNRVDARLLQDFFLNIGGERHNLQFIVDVINLPNLISNKWGVRDSYTVNNPLTFKGIVNGAPTFNMVTDNKGVLRTETFQKLISASTTWQMQLGLKYFF